MATWLIQRKKVTIYIFLLSSELDNKSKRIIKVIFVPRLVCLIVRIFFKPCLKYINYYQKPYMLLNPVVFRKIKYQREIALDSFYEKLTKENTCPEVPFF